MTVKRLLSMVSTLAIMAVSTAEAQTPASNADSTSTHKKIRLKPHYGTDGVYITGYRKDRTPLFSNLRTADAGVFLINPVHSDELVSSIGKMPGPLNNNTRMALGVSGNIGNDSARISPFVGSLIGSGFVYGASASVSKGRTTLGSGIYLQGISPALAFVQASQNISKDNTKLKSINLSGSTSKKEELRTSKIIAEYEQSILLGKLDKFSPSVDAGLFFQSEKTSSNPAKTGYGPIIGAKMHFNKIALHGGPFVAYDIKNKKMSGGIRFSFANKHKIFSRKKP